jgi:hypothetical protein
MTTRAEQVETEPAKTPVFPSQADASWLLLEYERAAADAEEASAGESRREPRRLDALFRPSFAPST